MTFTRPDLWVAPAEVTRRWLRAYGPGTREDLARWFAFHSPARAGRMLDALGDEVIEVTWTAAPCGCWPTTCRRSPGFARAGPRGSCPGSTSGS